MSIFIDRFMKKMPVSWRYNWCERGLDCECVGAANCAGGTAKAGFNRKDWEDWVSRNPAPEGVTVPTLTYYTPHLTQQAEVQTAEQYFAWLDSLTKPELEAYEEGRLARGARFEVVDKIEAVKK